MTQSEVVTRLSTELAIRLGDLDYLQLCRQYIQMALAIGIEHFTRDMEEIIVMNKKGVEIERLESISECEKTLGVSQESITAVLAGRQFTAGGLRFQKVTYKELVPVKKTA
jgi:hypothetical protein